MAFPALIIPPQVCAIAIGSLQKKPVVKEDEVVISEFLPITIAADHRALDFADLSPFLMRTREVLANEDLLRSYLD